MEGEGAGGTTAVAAFPPMDGEGAGGTTAVAAFPPMEGEGVGGTTAVAAFPPMDGEDAGGMTAALDACCGRAGLELVELGLVCWTGELGTGADSAEAGFDKGSIR